MAQVQPHSTPKSLMQAIKVAKANESEELESLERMAKAGKSPTRFRNHQVGEAPLELSTTPLSCATPSAHRRTDKRL